MKSLWKYIFTGLTLVIITIWMAVLTYPEKKLHLIACDVGQGDAILAVYGSTQILIDGGPSNKILDCLASEMPFWDRKIEVVVLTHPQLDHFNGLKEVFERFEVELFLSTDPGFGTQEYRALESTVGGSGVKRVEATSGMVIRSGLMHLDIVWPLNSRVLAKEEKDLNDYSIVAILKLENFEALLTGDIGPAVIDEIIKTGRIRDVEYLKVPHHGSKNGLSSELLDVSRPEVAVISVGAKNSYGHPHGQILTMLEEKGVKIFRTDLDGSIEIVTDGQKWWVE